jgi:hypothetical protein
VRPERRRRPPIFVTRGEERGEWMFFVQKANGDDD